MENNVLTLPQLARMIDISAVRTDVGLEEVEHMCEIAKASNFIAVFAMPWCTTRVVELLSDTPQVHVGGVVSFPDGAVSTQTKIDEAKELVRIGCQEIDMVMNIGALKSNMKEYIANELKEMRHITNGRIMKVIIEAPLLTAEEVISACKLTAESGADFVKTGTGWHGATEETLVGLMCETVKGKCKVKVAGGVRNLETIMKYKAFGVERFGIGLKPAIEIMKEAQIILGG